MKVSSKSKIFYLVSSLFVYCAGIYFLDLNKNPRVKVANLVIETEGK